MILKNKRFGNVEDITSLEFGKGDILVTPGIGDDKDYACVMFRNDVHGEIGRESEMYNGKTSDDLQPDVVMFFDKAESIDVVIDVLNKAKAALIGLNKQ